MSRRPATATPTLPGMRTPAERWRRFHALNPRVYALFAQFAGEARAAGLTRFSADAILHRIRWFVAVETRGDTFKLNNDWAAYYARQLIADDPSFGTFFELRAADPLPGGE